MEIQGHIKELLKRIRITIISFIVLFVASFVFAKPVVLWLLAQGEQGGIHVKYVYLYPQELFMQYFSMGILLAFVLCIPVLIYNVIRFISPAMEENKISLYVGAIFSELLFIGGVAFALIIMTPFVMSYFSEINTASGIPGMVSVEKYLGFIKSMTLAFGIVFEIPIVSVLFVQLGVLSTQTMKKIRPVVVVITFIVAAMITPPDILSQFMVAIPMLVLYQVSILLSTIIEKKKNKKNKKEVEKEPEHFGEESEASVC